MGTHTIAQDIYLAIYDDETLIKWVRDLTQKVLKTRDGRQCDTSFSIFTDQEDGNGWIRACYFTFK